MSARRPGSVDDQAAAWLGARDGGLSDTQQADFERWLLADRRHADAFARLERCSQALDRLADLQPERSVERRHRPGWRWPALALAAAAALAVGTFFGWRSPAPRDFAHVAATAAGTARTVPLPDGSEIVLNADSEVAVAYGSAARAVDLVRGEAHFKVAPEARRPFTVRIGGVAVRAVGTAFNLRRHADTVEVLVTHGRVDVQETRDGRSLLGGAAAATADPPVLVAGQLMVVSGIAATAASRPVPTPPETVAAPEMERRLAWREQRLELGPTPLAQLVAEFNRTSPRRLVVADPAIAQLSVGGAFRIGDAETLVQLLETNFDLAAERRGNEIWLRRAAPARPPGPRN
ncbi:MAG: hypothetical protein B9S34_00195 [Opitutia bacterium Tous-C1TDCM]|nr:MAG: hypothetical protein B9S34_00195 [Opitutae bacterium Tous-C1TDCM]